MEDEMGWACGTYGGDRNAYRGKFERKEILVRFLTALRKHKTRIYV
jgi:hypothetical protein